MGMMGPNPASTFRRQFRTAPRLVDQVPGGRVATGVLASGSRSPDALSHHTTRLPPPRCAAHPDPSSSVEVDTPGPRSPAHALRSSIQRQLQ